MTTIAKAEISALGKDDYVNNGAGGTNNTCYDDDDEVK